jgi:hypothetical protein
MSNRQKGVTRKHLRLSRCEEKSKNEWSQVASLNGDVEQLRAPRHEFTERRSTRAEPPRKVHVPSDISTDQMRSSEAFWISYPRYAVH